MRAVPQRELRNDIARVLREVAAGETVQITVRGRIVAELHPPRRRRLTPAATALELLARPADPTWLAELREEREAAASGARDWS
jgi:prevent-host-death family protein